MNKKAVYFWISGYIKFSFGMGIFVGLGISLLSFPFDILVAFVIALILILKGQSQLEDADLLSNVSRDELFERD